MVVAVTDSVGESVGLAVGDAEDVVEYVGVGVGEFVEVAVSVTEGGAAQELKSLAMQLVSAPPARRQSAWPVPGAPMAHPGCRQV